VESRNSEDAEALVWRNDPSRPGGGLFIATQRTARALGEDIPTGTLVLPDPQTNEEDITTNVYSKEMAFSHATTNGSTSDATSLTPPSGDTFIPVTTPLRLVNDTTPRRTNVNPGMNSQSEVPHEVQVINMLDQFQNPATMQQDAAVNDGYLDGIPATMFEFGESDWGGTALSSRTHFNSLIDRLLLIIATKISRACCFQLSGIVFSSVFHSGPMVHHRNFRAQMETWPLPMGMGYSPPNLSKSYSVSDLSLLAGYRIVHDPSITSFSSVIHCQAM